MDVKYSVDTSHFFLSLNVFMVMITLSEALCPGLGQLENGTTFFRYGGIYATFTCNPGFRLLGHVSNSCIKGKWRKPVPVCVASGCLLPIGILHGSLRTSHNNAAIAFICNEGYKLFGSPLIYCNGKRWNSTLPVCRESDMMSSSLRKTFAQMGSSAFMGNSSLPRKSSEDLHRISYNTTQQNGLDNYLSDNSSRRNFTSIIRIKSIQDRKSSYQHKELSTFWKNESQRHLTPVDKLKPTNKPRPEERYAALFSTIQETPTEPPKIQITSRYNLSNKITTDRETIKWTENKTSKLVTIPFPTLNNYTQGSLVPKDYNPMTDNDVLSKSVFTSLFNGSSSHLRTTPSKVEGTTRTQFEEVFTGITHQSHSVRSQSPILRLLSTFPRTVRPEATTSKSSILKSTFGPPKHVTASANLNYSTDHSEYAKSEKKPIATIPSIILTSMTASFINYTQILSVSSLPQVTQGSISQNDCITNVKQYDYSKVVLEVTAKQSMPRYKTTANKSLHLAREPSVTIHGTEKMNVTTPRITSATHIPQTKANRNQIHHGALKSALKRRVWCSYPPIHIHGTFRFLTLKHPLPNQYPYYIQYYCYPGYTMTQGDMYSFCMENGTWSGITPICEDM